MTPAPLLLKRANGRLLSMGPAYLQRPTGASMRGSERAVLEAGRAACQDSSNMPDWTQGGLQLESLTSNLCILVMGYWHLSGSHHTMSGLKLLEIKTCSPSTWLFITLHLNKQSQSSLMATLLETHEMQPRWEYEVVIISPPEQRQISSLQSNRVAWLVGWFGCYYGFWQPWSALYKAKQRSYKSRTVVKLEKSVNIKS